MESNYSTFAADWWTKKIIEAPENMCIRGLDLFKEELSSKIKTLSSINGSMYISTYAGKSSNLLDQIAYDSGVKATIPRGFEMRIVFNNVFVYNSHAELVASF